MEAIIGIVLLIVLLLLGVPILFCFAAAALLISALNGSDVSFMLPTAYGNLSGIVLLSIPMFIMAGGVMARGRLGAALIDFVELFVGRIRGSLALVVVICSGIFGSISGSGVATMSCVGSILAPRMTEKKYPRGITASVLCCSATLGLLIPPSVIQIVYAWAAQQSVLACFLATVVPGITLAILLCIGSLILLRKQKQIEKLDKMPPAVWGRQLGRRTRTATPALLMPVIVLGGIYAGIMTPTEAAAVSVIYAIPVCIWIYKGIRFRDLKDVFASTATDTGVIMVMIGFVVILSRVLTQENIPQGLSSLISSVDNPLAILLLVNLFMIFLGMLMDDTCSTLLATPLLLPIIVSIGMSPIQFAAILGVNLGMGCITPPSAPFLYLAARICKVNINEMLKPVGFLILFAYIPVLLLVTYVPQFSLFLPQHLLGISLY